jgi:hypothetical protein
MNDLKAEWERPDGAHISSICEDNIRNDFKQREGKDG